MPSVSSGVMRSRSQSLHPELRGPHLDQIGMLVPVQEDHAHGMQMPQKTPQMRCGFIPVA